MLKKGSTRYSTELHFSEVTSFKIGTLEIQLIFFTEKLLSISEVCNL